MGRRVADKAPRPPAKTVRARRSARVRARDTGIGRDDRHLNDATDATDDELERRSRRARADEPEPRPRARGRVRNARAARRLESSARMTRRAIARFALAVFLVACACASPALALENCGDNVTSFRRWADLRAFRNPPLRGAFCVTRLSKAGVVGCSNDGVTSAPWTIATGRVDETIAPR